MKKLIIFLMVLISFSIFAKDLSREMRVMKYSKRAEPVLKAMLVYYGDYYTMTELESLKTNLEKKFHLATNKLIKLDTQDVKIIPYKYQISSFPDYTQPNITDPDRLQRLWYYDHVGAGVMKEVWEQVRAGLKTYDVLLIVTGAQFDGLGYANGRVAITENPMEIAWGLPGGGHVNFRREAEVIDELIHELGHTMFLDHAASPCQKPDLTPEETKACCEKSPNKNDVMSYCRNRRAVSDDFFYKFESCNLEIIEKKVIPAMLAGKDWNIANRPKCH